MLLPLKIQTFSKSRPLLKFYRLEGHQFAVFGFKLTSDFRFIVSVSNKFITWDVATSDVAGIVEPKVKGLMMELEISPDNRFAAAYTNNNQTILLNIMSSEYVVIDSPLGEKETVQGLILSNNVLFIYGQYTWCRYSTAGNQLDCTHKAHDNPILSMYVMMDVSENDILQTKQDSNPGSSKWDYSIIRWSGNIEDSNMILETINDGIESLPLEFHGGMVMNREKTKIWCCPDPKTNNVDMLQHQHGCWLGQKTYFHNSFPLSQLSLSKDESYIIGTFLNGFQLWHVDGEEECITLKLPHGIRNITVKMNKSNRCVLSFNNKYAVAGVRQNLYIWLVISGILVISLDAHFARINDVTPLIYDTWNCIITSSMDRTVKVWNLKNVFEQVHHIDRHESQIDSISLCTNVGIAVTVTRGCVGIWDILTGKLKSTLSDSALGAIITHAIVTSKGNYIVSAESGIVIYWEVLGEKVVYKEKQQNILQLMLYDHNNKCIVISSDSRESSTHASGLEKQLNATCISRKIPDGVHNFTFEFTYKQYKNLVLTSDSKYFVGYGYEKQKDTLFVFDVGTGNLLHKFLVRYEHFKDVTTIVALPDNPRQVALIDQEKGNVVDLQDKKCVRSIPRWGGKILTLAQNKLETVIVIF